MDKRSTHWADVLIWLEKVAESCETKEQAENCERLVWNFHRTYQNLLGLGECFDLTQKIDRKLTDIILSLYGSKKKYESSIHR